MLQNSFGVQLSYASVDRGDGSDPRTAAQDVLARLRVLAGLRDATGDWGDAQDAVLAIPLTDDRHVLTLDDEDGVASTLSTAELRAAFQEHGLTLWLDADDDTEDDTDEEADDALDISVEGDVDGEDAEEDMVDIDPALFDTPTVQVSAFSHRGPTIARVLASARRTPVDHRESGDWSLQQFESADPTADWVSSRAELPLIELSRTESGAWFDVTAVGTGTVPFWPDAERDTRAVLDIDAIRVPETAEIYRRLLTEGDGSRDELLGLAAVVPLDLDAAHRALIPESLGGVVGSEARLRAFVAAFGVAPDLIEAAFAENATVPQRRFLPTGWWPTLRETAIAGMGELSPLTRRRRPLVRLEDALLRRPALGLSVTLGELGTGVWAASRWRGLGRFLGVLLIVDAVIDTAIWVTRIRRGRRP